MPALDREKALDVALAQIDKQFGKGSVMRLGDETRVPIQVIPTGSISLDLALGIGGLPRGRVVEIYGPESSGKTTLTLHAVANAQKLGGAVAFLTDQAGLNLASTFVPFFGRPAKTPRGPAVFALRLGTPVVFGTALRLPTGRYHLSFEEVAVTESGDVDRDVDELVESYTRILEKWVRRAPEQYFWQHRRWKRQPEDTPEELRDPVATSRG